MPHTTLVAMYKQSLFSSLERHQRCYSHQPEHSTHGALPVWRKCTKRRYAEDSYDQRSYANTEKGNYLLKLFCFLFIDRLHSLSGPGGWYSTGVRAASNAAVSSEGLHHGMD